MSLDIKFTSYEDVVCPHCEEVIGTKEVNCVGSCGRGWYPILEELGYYVPYEQRTDENDWYGKDMVLTAEQADKVFWFLHKNTDLYNGDDVSFLIASAAYKQNKIVVNADW